MGNRRRHGRGEDGDGDGIFRIQAVEQRKRPKRNLPTPFPELVCAVKWNRERRRRRRQLKNPHSVVPISDGSTGNLHSASRKYRGSQQERQLYRREGQGAPPRQHQQHRRRRHPGENRGYWSPSQVKTRGMCPNLRKAAIASRHVKRRVSPYQRHIL